MTAINYLNEKFAPAVLPDIYAPRRKLIQELKSIKGIRFFYISAPAGYGKTLSTLLWLKSSGHKIIWIGLDSYDNTPHLFYKLFCTGISSIQSDNEAILNIIRNQSFSSSPVEQTIEVLSNIVPENGKFALVLDDMHEITHEEILKSMPYVFKRLPVNFDVFILSRNEPRDSIKNYIECGKMKLITSEQLAFKSDDIKDCFTKSGHSITGNEVSKILKYTEGWPIGVSALALSRNTELSETKGNILGNYIKKQIWDKWDNQTREFLLKTAVVDEMTPELCNRLTGFQNSEEILENLYNSNYFIRRSSGNVYTYHQLFLEFLRDLQKAFDTKPLNKIVAEYYIEKGDVLTPRRYALKSEDIETITKAVFKYNQYNENNVSIDDYVNFRRNFNRDDLPEVVCDKYPFLYLSHVWFNFLAGDSKKTEYYFDKLYKFLPVIENEYSQFLELTVLILISDYRYTIYEQYEKFKLVDIKDLHDKQMGPTITMHMPFIHRGFRDFIELLDIKRFNKCKPLLSKLIKHNLDIFISGVQACLLYEKNLLKEALELAVKSKKKISGSDTDELIFTWDVLISSIYFNMGNDFASDEIINEIDKNITERKSYYLSANFAAYKTRLELVKGNKNAATQWLDNYYVTDSKQMELYKAYQYFTTARAYIILGKLHKALEYVFDIKQLGLDYNRTLDVFEAMVLQSIIEWNLSKRKEAVDTLERTLILMQKYGFVRIVAEEGAAILPVLNKIITKLKRGKASDELDATFTNDVLIAVYEQSKRRKGITELIEVKPVKLSNQQTRVLNYIAQGKKNVQIAEITGLSVHTIKCHTSIAYSKLGVNNAMDAVLKARELGVIE